MDVDKYRKRFEAELAKAEPPKPSHRGAGRAAGGERATPAARASAIAIAPLDEEGRADQVAALLATLGKRDEPVEVRLAALRALRALEFLGPQFTPFRAEYMQVLREVAADPALELRETALEVLAINKDPYAQELLVRGLEEPKEALVPEAKAIQFLGYDDHAELAPLVRRVYERAKGPAREEALRFLATDPESEKLFGRLLTDKSEKRSIRRLSVSGLQSLNPDAFEKVAHRIVGDDGDDDDIRATALAALAYGREAREKPADPKLVRTVEKLRDTARSPAMRASIGRFLKSTER